MGLGQLDKIVNIKFLYKFSCCFSGIAMMRRSEFEQTFQNSKFYAVYAVFTYFSQLQKHSGKVYNVGHS